MRTTIIEGLLCDGFPYNRNHTSATTNPHSNLAKATCPSSLYKCADRFIEVKEFSFVRMLWMHTRFEYRSVSF